MNPKSVFICVCSARSHMLAECLNSIIRQESRAGWAVRIVVVENSVEQKSRNTVALIEQKSSFPIDYIHEPKTGIPFARNRAIDFSISRNAGWIAFIDDDETAEPSWLSSYLEEAEKTDADILHGRRRAIFPEPAPFWASEKKNKPVPSGRQIKTASTNNVMIRDLVVRTDKHNLRFDESMRYTGGTDRDFFFRASRLGAKIIWLNEPVVSETVSPSRLTFGYQFMMSLESSACATRVNVKNRGYATALAKCSSKTLPKLILGLFLLTFAPLLIFLGKNIFKETVMKSARLISSGIGYIVGYTDFTLNLYKKDSD